ncbi:NAD-dependent epimerase/dehydratase family protein [bacterium]|nr:NAD-dependent epimerase/dehydratase family protein [bacterium]
MQRLLITGAAGGLGSAMRGRLAPLARTLRLSDIAPIANPAAHEEVVPCDLADAAAMRALVAGCDGVVHFGGRSVEDSWPVIRAANIDGVLNLYEAARKEGVRRIVFASSNHVIGFYPPSQRLDGATPPRPDGLYGLSKAFGEDLAQLYWDKFQIETVCIRIGSCFPKPRNHRMLSTWLSYDDLAALIACSFAAPKVGCTIVYGVSANAQGWWDNAHAAHLGWTPKDNAEAWRAEIEAAAPAPGPEAPESLWQGAQFAAQGIVAP